MYLLARRDRKDVITTRSSRIRSSRMEKTSDLEVWRREGKRSLKEAEAAPRRTLRRLRNPKRTMVVANDDSREKAPKQRQPHRNKNFNLE